MLKGKFRFLLFPVIVIICILIIWLQPLRFGLDIRGGARIVIEAQDTEERKVDMLTMETLYRVIQKRLNPQGDLELIVQRKGMKQMIVEVPESQDVEGILKMISKQAVLKFVEAVAPPKPLDEMSEEEKKILLGGEGRIATYTTFDDEGVTKNTYTLFLKDVVLTGEDLKDVYLGHQEGMPVIGLKFTADGTKKFAEATERNIGNPIAIILDGKIISAPTVRSAILNGQAIIEGNFTQKELTELIIQLRSGSLPVPIEIVENKIVGPLLGQDSIQKGKFAGMLGLIGVTLFMFIFYRAAGVSAVVSLIMYLFIYLAIICLGKTTLTLSGVAGIVLSLGIAVDANIIIFEWLREELHMGKDVAFSVGDSFKRAFWTIFDSNLTTILAAGVLFFIGTGSVKGFAMTLCLGIMVSMFTALVLNRYILEGYVEMFKGKKFLV
ncbi:protein translocase subunit SecD [Candidatus Margulisiibacteriota bacterium]